MQQSLHIAKLSSGSSRMRTMVSVTFNGLKENWALYLEERMHGLFPQCFHIQFRCGMSQKKNKENAEQNKNTFLLGSQQLLSFNAGDMVNKLLLSIQTVETSSFTVAFFLRRRNLLFRSIPLLTRTLQRYRNSRTACQNAGPIAAGTPPALLEPYRQVTTPR